MREIFSTFGTLKSVELSIDKVCPWLRVHCACRQAPVMQRNMQSDHNMIPFPLIV